MTDCPCGYGKNIPENQKYCPACGTDLTPLHRLNGLSRSYYKAGVGAIEEGKWDEGLEKLNAAVALNPGYVEAHVLLGDTLAEKGSYEESLFHYKKALEIKPDDEEIQRKKDKTEKAKEKPATTKPFNKSLFVILPILAFIVGLSIFPVSRYLIKEKIQAGPIVQASEIKEIILDHPDLQGLDLEVIIQENGLSVSGEVPSKLHKSLIAEITASYAQTSHVDLLKIIVVPPPVKPRKEKPVVISYTVRPNDSLALIAAIFYSDSRMWSRIFEANKDKIKSPHEISAGQVLTIPLR